MSNQSTMDNQEVAKFNQHAGSWWDTEGPLKTLHDINPTRLEFIKQFASLTNKKILDVGCGGGILAEAMAQSGGKVFGIDASSNAIECAKSHALMGNLLISYNCELIEDYEEGPFDIVTCLEMLEHVQNPDVVISHCMRLLKPGGWLFLSTINRTVKAYGYAVIGAEYMLKILPKQTHEYAKFIKPSELAHMARKVDLELVIMNGLNYNPFGRTAFLSTDLSVNYLAAFRRSEP